MNKAYLPRIACGLISFAAALALRGASPEQQPVVQPPPPPLANAILAPALKAAADRDHVALFHLDGTGDSPRLGDSAVAWVGARDRKGTRQWLIQFRRSVATAAEQQAHGDRDKKKYLSWGPVVSFESNVEALDLWIAGPVVASDARKAVDIAPVKRVRVLVPADYLRLGLDDSVRVSVHIGRRVQALQKEDATFQLGHIYTLDKPIKPENVAYARPVADKIQFTPEMERAWVGGYVALQSFYDLANDVPEIEAIASVAIDKPSILTLAKVATGTLFVTSFYGADPLSVDPSKLGLVPVSTEAFNTQFSFSFGNHPIVGGAMIVTKPVPPFDTTAGILGLVAQHPKDPNRQVHIAIISGARREP